MDQGKCLQIVRAYIWARKYVIVQQGKYLKEAKTKHEWQSEIARGPKFKTSRKLRPKGF